MREGDHVMAERVRPNVGFAGGTGTANGRAAPKAFGVKSPTLQAEATATGAVALQLACGNGRTAYEVRGYKGTAGSAPDGRGYKGTVLRTRGRRPADIVRRYRRTGPHNI